MWAVQRQGQGESVLDIQMLVGEIVRYTDPVHAQRIAVEYLQFKKVEYTVLYDDFNNAYAIMFETYILDLQTHEIMEIH